MARTPELVSFDGSSQVNGVALVLPGGMVRSRGRYWKFFDISLRNLCRTLATQGEAHGLAVYLLRYRYRGWNGERADTAVDARWALAELRSRHGDVPVALVGNSLVGRAAFSVAGEPQVAGVVGVAPWLPEGEPVEQLAGRKVLILHGDQDRSDAPASLSLAYAERARAVVPDLARFEVVGDGHYLLRRAIDCWAATTGFVLGALGMRPLDPAAEDLRTPLPVGITV
jgi:pimeloyl-ACP methyl ester carboxylesterase